MNLSKTFITIIIIVLLLLIVGLVIQTKIVFKYKTESKEITALYKADSAKLVIYHNKYQEEVAKSEVLSTTNTELFTKLEFKDVETRKLQAIVIKYEKENKDLTTALLISNNTIVYLRDSITNSIVGWETGKDTTKKYPIYYRIFEIPTCFTTGDVTLGRNKFDINIKTNNEYEVAIGSEKIGWFKSKQFAEITNKNKCTTTSVMKVYDKKEKVNNTVTSFLWGSGVGVGAILILKLILL